MTPATQRMDRQLLILVGVILVFGLVMLSSASTVVGYQQFGDSTHFVKRQIFNGVFLGLIAFCITSHIPYHAWRRLAVPIMGVTIILLVIVFIPGIGYTFGGATRWISLGGFFLLQPTELAKLSFLIYLAAWVTKQGKGVADFSKGFIPFVTLLGIIGALVLLEPDFSTMVVITLISMTVFFVSGANWRHLVGFGSVGVALLGMLIAFAPYRAARFTVFLNPEIDPQGIGYHINQALLAIGSGGIFGVGLGHSRQKFNYLPEVSGDSIFAVIAEELGFIFAALLLVTFFTIMLRGFRIARKAPDDFGKYIAIGITVWIAFQAFFNIGAMVGLLPLTGIPLPFISYGSSAMIMMLAALGILANISAGGRVAPIRLNLRRKTGRMQS